MKSNSFEYCFLITLFLLTLLAVLLDFLISHANLIYSTIDYLCSFLDLTCLSYQVDVNTYASADYLDKMFLNTQFNRFFTSMLVLRWTN